MLRHNNNDHHSSSNNIHFISAATPSVTKSIASECAGYYPAVRTENPSFTKLLRYSDEHCSLTLRQHEAAIEFLAEHMTYCDEIFDCLARSEHDLQDFSSDSSSQLDILERATATLLKRIHKARHNNQYYQQE